MNLLEIMKDEKDVTIEMLKNDLREKEEAYEKSLREKQLQLEKVEEKLAEAMQANRNLARRLKEILQELEEERKKNLFWRVRSKYKIYMEKIIGYF